MLVFVQSAILHVYLRGRGPDDFVGVFFCFGPRNAQTITTCIFRFAGLFFGFILPAYPPLTVQFNCTNNE